MNNNTSAIRTNDVNEKTISISGVAVFIMLVLTALTGIVNQTVLSLGVVLCCAILFLYDKLHLALPFMIFYNSFYGVLFGVSLLRFYTLFVLARIMMKVTEKTSFSIKHLIPLVVYVLFIVSTMIPAVGVMSSMMIILDVIVCFMLVSQIVELGEDTIKDIFKIYSFVCLLSFITGLITENKLGDEYNYTRYMATFEDPNYMGMFFTVAVFALVTLKLFDKRVRVLLVLALYACILSTLSITAIIVNAVLWVAYLTILKKIKIKAVIAIGVVFVVAFAIFRYGVDNPTTPVLGDLASRVNDKLISLEAGDMSGVTTGRSNLAAEHLEYYINLPFFNVLFGGISSNARYINPDLGYAAHNEYVDLLLNVGFIGTLIMLIYFIGRSSPHIRDYRSTKGEKSLFFIMTKCIWAMYALALTMFLDFRFMIFFLI